MTRRDARALTPELRRVFGGEWTLFADRQGRLVLYTPNRAELAVDTWTQPHPDNLHHTVRRVVLRRKTWGQLVGLRDVPPDRGWAARAAEAVREMLEVRT